MYVKLLDGNLNPVSCPSIPEELVLIKLPSRHSSCHSIPQRLVFIKLPSRQGVQCSCVVVIIIIIIIIYVRERERERERGFQFHHFVRVWLHTIK